MERRPLQGSDKRFVLADGESGVRIVRSGWTRVFAPILGSGLAGAVLLISAGDMLRGRPIEWTWIVVGVAVPLGMFFALVRLLLIRNVEISDGGLAFNRGPNRIQVAWDNLVPLDNYHPLAWTLKYRLNGQRVETDTLTISWTMARAIFNDPRCPGYTLPPMISSKLKAG